MSAPITNIPFSNPLYRNHNFYRRYGKRALDFTGALFGLICLFPVLAILAILLAIVQRTSPFSSCKSASGTASNPFISSNSKP